MVKVANKVGVLVGKNQEGRPSLKPEDDIFLNPVGPNADAPSLKYNLGVGDEDENISNSIDSSTGLLSEIFASTESNKTIPSSPLSSKSSGPPVDSILTDPPTGTTNNGVTKFLKSSFQSVTNSELVSSMTGGDVCGFLSEVKAILQLLKESQVFQFLMVILLLNVFLFMVIDYLFVM